MKSRSEIWLRALDELGAQCSVSTQRDAETLASRVAQEGESFFTLTLPAFGKDLEQALSYSRIPRHCFTGFKRAKLEVDVLSDYQMVLYSKKFGGGNPRFLGGFLDLVFCDNLQMHEDELRFAEAHPSIMLVPRLRRDGDLGRMADAITAIRQLCLMFSKEKERCSDSRVEAAYRSYIETEKEIDAPLWTVDRTDSSEKA